MQDSLPEADAKQARRKLRAGEVFSTKLETAVDGRAIDVPSGLVHHWLGSVFIPNARVDELVEWLQDYDEHHRYFDEVESSRLVSRDGDDFRIFLRLRRKKVVTVHYNTDHFVRYTRHGEGRTSSVSYATRIAELESVSLSRGVPVGVRWLVGGYLDSVPRESLEATLLPIQREAPRALVTEDHRESPAVSQPE
jgi:hypothetical protein